MYAYTSRAPQEKAPYPYRPIFMRVYAAATVRCVRFLSRDLILFFFLFFVPFYVPFPRALAHNLIYRPRPPGDLLWYDNLLYRVT